MDFSTVLGLASFVVLIVLGVITKQIPASILNPHAVFVVLGGCSVAMMLNTPFKYLVKAVTELKVLMLDDDTVNFNRVIPIITALTEQCRIKGLSALKDADPTVARGFLTLKPNVDVLEHTSSTASARRRRESGGP